MRNELDLLNMSEQRGADCECTMDGESARTASASKNDCISQDLYARTQALYRVGVDSIGVDTEWTLRLSPTHTLYDVGLLLR